jgi:hypothetical protein
MTKSTALKEPLKESTLLAWRRIVDPLVELLFDSGVTVHEVSQLIRERAVRAADRTIFNKSGRSSNSRVAIMTGLSRSEVARILHAKDLSSAKRLGQHPGGRVLSAWYESAPFLSANGDPATLPIFGKHRSFEKLVLLNSGGIPVRAMLDQLSQVDAIEVLPGQRVRPKSRIPVFTGLSSAAIASIGERGADLIETLKTNLRKSSNPLFEGTAIVGNVNSDVIPLIRREIAEQGVNFIESANSLLKRHKSKPRKSARQAKPTFRVGVTLYYFESETGEKTSGSVGETGPRKNLQRRIREKSSTQIRSHIDRKNRRETQ